MKKILLFSFLMQHVGPIFSQDTPSWKIEFLSPVNFSELHEPTGMLLISNDEGLQAIDPDRKQVIWTKSSFKNVPESVFKESDESPYLHFEDFDPKDSITNVDKSKTKSTPKGKRSIILDPLTGHTLFDTDSINIKKITTIRNITESNALLIEGTDAADNRVMGVVSLISGKLLWIKEKPVKLKKITTRDNLDFKIDPEGNILITYTDTTYRMDFQTGKYFWKKQGNYISNSFIGPRSGNYFANFYGWKAISLKDGSVLRGEKIDKDTSNNTLPYFGSLTTTKPDSFTTAKEMLRSSTYLSRYSENQFILVGNESFNIFDEEFNSKWDSTSFIFSISC